MGGSPTLATDFSGKVALIDNVIGGLINVGIDYSIHKVTGQCYGVGDLLLDFRLGFATDGLSTLNDLKNAVKVGRAAKAIANPVSDTLARVVPHNINPSTLAKTGDLDVFVTNASELRGLSNSQIAEKLTIPEIPGGFKVIEFPSSSVNGIASPVFRTNPGFIQGGKTARGAAEFVIPNGPIPTGATQWIPY